MMFFRRALSTRVLLNNNLKRQYSNVRERHVGYHVITARSENGTARVDCSLPTNHLKLSLNDEGLPSPLDTTLCALVTCEVSIAKYLAHYVFDRMEIGAMIFDKVEGINDIRGFTTGEVPAKFQSVTMSVRVETSESNEKLQELHHMVQKRCPVYATFLDAGVVMNSTWTKIDMPTSK
jgi:putative redox protein